MKLFIFYAAYLYFPFLAFCLYKAARHKGAIPIVFALCILGSSLLAYGRFVEPRLLNTHSETIFTQGADETSPSIRIALFSDTHFGIFKNAMPMSRIVRRINDEAPDAVFISGDFLYHLPPEDIPAALAPLAELSAPIYAVLGNHDVGFPGPIYTGDLYSALHALGVTLVENRAYEARIGGQDILIGGTSDLWQRQQDFSFTNTLPDKPLILLTHNPDTALNVPNNIPFALMLAGHTHGGQVRIPGLIKKVIPTQYPFDKGLHSVPKGDIERLVYVTTGTGMVGLPFRFNMPPRIDILTVHLPAP